MNNPRLRSGLLSLTCLTLAASSAFPDAFRFYEEEAQVVTASRRKEPAWRAPVAVDVVTAEEIRAFGYEVLWDILRSRAGMDVIEGRSLDGNRALVSARGFTTEFVAELQVLVDGRSVYSPFLGGVYWQSLPVQIQDIERIEIVRGPNAVLYGPNAGLGVINIITRRSSDAKGASASASGSSRAGWTQSAAVETGNHDAGLRVSYTGLTNDGHGASDGQSNGDDFLISRKINARGRWRPAAATEVEFLGGGSWMTAGLPGLVDDAQNQQRQNFESVRITQIMRPEEAVELQLSRSESHIRVNPVFAGDVRIRTYQYDADILHRSSWCEGRLKSNWGANWREMGADSNQSFNPDSREGSRLLRGFMHHSVLLADPLTFVAGASIEHSGTGQTQGAWQSALLLTPSPSQSLRFSYAHAPTIPPLFDQRGQFSLSQGQTFMGNRSYRPEKLTSWEGGWTSRYLDGAFKPSVTIYYMRIDDYGALTALPNGLLTIQNTDRADARGLEASAEIAGASHRSLFLNYTLERITHRAPPSPTGYDASRSTPRHKFNVGGRISFLRSWSASTIVGYKDSYQASSTSRAQTADIARHFRLDARVSWDVKPEWTLFVAGHELLQKYFGEYVDGTATQRSVSAGIEARFGL